MTGLLILTAILLTSYAYRVTADATRMLIPMIKNDEDSEL